MCTYISSCIDSSRRAGLIHQEKSSREARSESRQLLLLMKLVPPLFKKTVNFRLYLYSITLYDFRYANSTPSSSLSPEKNKNTSIDVRVYMCVYISNFIDSSRRTALHSRREAINEKRIPLIASLLDE